MQSFWRRGINGTSNILSKMVPKGRESVSMGFRGQKGKGERYQRLSSWRVEVLPLTSGEKDWYFRVTGQQDFSSQSLRTRISKVSSPTPSQGICSLGSVPEKGLLTCAIHTSGLALPQPPALPRPELSCPQVPPLPGGD